MGTRIAARGQMIDRYLTRDLGEAKARGRIRVDHVRVGRDIVLGSIFYGIETMLIEPTQDHHPEQLMRCVLVGLGVPPSDALRIAHEPLPALRAAEGSILSRTPSGA